jgi:hypothetical protein
MAQQEGTSGGAKAGGETAGTEDATVRDFFARFARALAAGNARAIASMWQTPALAVGDRDLQPLATPREVEAFFAGAKEDYDARGVSEARPEVVRVDWLTERVAQVRVRWPYRDRSGADLGEESSTYVVRQDDVGQLRICVVVMHGAVTRH